MTRHRTRLALLAVLAVGALLAGCGGEDDAPETEPPATAPTQGLTLVPVKDTAEPGGTLTYRLRNESDRRATYGACPTLERLEDGDYVPARSGPVACIEIAYVTEPGETGRDLGVSVPAGAPPGEYRVTHEITLGTEQGEEVETVAVTAPATLVGR